MQGFRKVDPDRWEFANEGFLRGQKHLLKSISRRKPVGGGSTSLPATPHPPTPAGPCVEVGKFGIEEEIERLKRDKNVLMQELIKLRQQQAATDHDLQSLGQQLQGMERRQQQMMSFLAKAVQNPGLLASFVNQPASTRRLGGNGGKKRRLPNGEDGSSPDGQIVKYQPLMNEAAKALLLQILQMDSSPLPSPSARSSAAISEIRSPPGPMESSAGSLLATMAVDGDQSVSVKVGQLVTSEANNGGQWPAVAAANEGRLVMEVLVPGMVADGGQGAPAAAVSSGQLAVDEGQLVAELEAWDEDIDCETEDESSKLPGISDAFWEQFLAESPPHGDSGGWEPAEEDEGMERITEQMGQLTSEPDKW